jgi:hypothetical protein
VRCGSIRGRKVLALNKLGPVRTGIAMALNRLERYHYLEIVRAEPEPYGSGGLRLDGVGDGRRALRRCRTTCLVVLRTARQWLARPGSTIPTLFCVTGAGSCNLKTLDRR